ncbi:hypothetical protein [Streptomyces sp. NPDC048527]|uniref:hypothetical protein n=1 Tax=Streptomyces sp. NPDC048527 TaxID=3365568 RepID=UPI00371D0F9B
MLISLTKKESGGYLATARIEAGAVEVLVAETDHNHTLPHELSHIAIEGCLSLDWGFWGCVSRGALFDGMKILNGRDEDAAAEISAAVRADAGARFYKAEIMVAAVEDSYPDGHIKDAEECRALAGRSYEDLRKEILAVDFSEIAEQLGALVDEWASLPPGGTLSREWVTPRNPLDFTVDPV